MKTVAIILAAGSGKRFGSETPKQFLKVSGKPLLAHTIQRFEDTDEVDEIFVVAAETQMEFVREKIIEMNCFAKVTRVIAGGATRAESTRNALTELRMTPRWSQCMTAPVRWLRHPTLRRSYASQRTRRPLCWLVRLVTQSNL